MIFPTGQTNRLRKEHLVCSQKSYHSNYFSHHDNTRIREYKGQGKLVI